jgi:Flp pilus assembly pilin Flp
LVSARSPTALGDDMSRMLAQLCADDRGQDLIEYALLASLIAIVSIASLKILGTHVKSTFALINKALN